MPKEAVPYTVACHDGAEPNGIANIMAALLAQNFANKPDLVKVAHKMKRPVAVVSTDTETEATIDFGAAGIVIYNGIVGEPNVAVHATADQILEMSRLKTRAGGLLPVWLFTGRGAKIVGELATRRLVIKGLLSHTVASMRTLALVSLAD